MRGLFAMSASVTVRELPRDASGEDISFVSLFFLGHSLFHLWKLAEDVDAAIRACSDAFKDSTVYLLLQSKPTPKN